MSAPSKMNPSDRWVGVKWIKVSEELPDSDVTVMICNAEWDEPVTMGYLDGDVWRTMDACSLDEEHGELAPPTYWAQMPELPEGAQ